MDWKNSFRGVTVLLDIVLFRMLCLAVLYTIIYWQEQINNNLFIMSSHLSLWQIIFFSFFYFQIKLLDKILQKDTKSQQNGLIQKVQLRRGTKFIITKQHFYVELLTKIHSTFSW